MEQCFRCLRDEEEVRLLDAIDGDEIVRICEECALVEEIPIIRKPTSYQLRETDKPYTVYQRLSRMAGLPASKTEDKVKLTLDKLTKAKNYDKPSFEIKRQQSIARNKPLYLVDNFHWHIQAARRKKHLTLKQVSDALGESEEAVKMIESGDLPGDGDRIINKLEQYFGIFLRKKEFQKEQERIEAVRKPARVLNFDNNSLKTITIADLQRMKLERQKAEIEEIPEFKDEESSEIELEGGEEVGQIEFLDD
ncbi:MAG: helix-turn-helix transcriptional regulator [archaeon]